MRTRTAIVVMFSLVAGSAAADSAESTSVVATGKLRLRARPGETAAVVARADRGEELKVVDEWGRWLRVRHGKRIGWVTRTQVEQRDGERAKAPRKRSERGGFSGKAREDALRVTIDADRVRGFDDPRTKKTCVLDLARGDEVTVIGRGHEGWILVEQAGGVIGWIPAAAVTDAGEFAGNPREPEVRIVMEEGDVIEGPVKAESATVRPTRRVSSRFVAGVAGGAGAQTFAMRQTGAVESMAIASGPAASLAAGGRMRVTGNIWVGGGADAEMATGNLTYYSGTEQSAPMATKGTTVDARIAAGYGPSWHVQAQAGYHYASLEVTSDRAEPMLLGEQIAGMTVGVGGGLPIGRKLAVSASVDVMPAGAQRPTELPPGVLYASAMQAGWARATVAYQLPLRMVAAVSYRGGMATTNLTDGAETPTTATRTDQSHALTAGLGLHW